MHEWPLVALVILALLSTGPVFAETLCLEGGKPLIGIYYFPHWWEPWRSDDDRVLTELELLSGMGYNTLFIDHQWSQMIDGNWALVDRGHRLAKEAGVAILPWLSIGFWNMGSSPELRAKAEAMYDLHFDMGLGLDGKINETKPYDPAVIEYGYRYVCDYLERYLASGAILRVLDEGKSRPVIALTVELKWFGSYDPLTQRLLRLWLRARYDANIVALNQCWGTSYRGFEWVDLADQTVFDVEGQVSGKAVHPQAVEDWVEFRSQVIDASFAELKRRLLEIYPDLLVAAELPYQFKGEHPDAKGYRIRCGANPSCARNADVLVIRATDTLSPREEEVLLTERALTGQRVILSYRLASSFWGPRLREDIAGFELMNHQFAEQAAQSADGFGLYSWNEMGDTHVVPDPEPPLYSFLAPNTQADYELTLEALRRMASTYSESVR